MVKIFVVAQIVPMPDRYGGRMFRLLEILAERYEVHFYPCNLADQVAEFGIRGLARYEAALVELGVAVHYGPRDAVSRLLHRHKFDIALLVQHHFARPFLDEIRYVQPHAKVVIDTVDLQYASMLSRASASRRTSDFKAARRMKKAELSAYRKCDMVIAISEHEKSILAREDASLNVEVIPLIHELPAVQAGRAGASCNVLFVGNFVHMPNIDGILFFCAEVFH